MTRWATLAIALLFSAIATVQYTGTASGQAGGGWITLFDGKNLDQWEGDGTATFKIEDGSVIAIDKKDPKAVAAYLVSKQSYKDFEIRAEFWVSDDANSGIFIRDTDPKNISSKTGYEVNIFDQRPDPSLGTGGIVDVAKALTRSRPAASGTPTRSRPRPEVHAHAQRHEDRRRRGECRFDKAGPIALQFGVGTVKFRKIEIKPL